VKIFYNISDYDSNQGDFINWCYTIVTNASIDQFRRRIKAEKKENYIKISHNTLDPGSYDKLEARELVSILNEAVIKSGLSERQRLIWNHYRAGYDIPYIAKTILKNTGEASKNIVSRELWKIKRKLSLYLWTYYPDMADSCKRLEFLFSAELSFVRELDRGNIPDELRQLFELNKIKSPDKVIKPHDRKYIFWLMTNKDSPVYMARRENEKLNVYR
jgi:hypothetical protein